MDGLKLRIDEGTDLYYLVYPSNGYKDGNIDGSIFVVLQGL